jgi:hypothetical protein
VWAGSGGTGLVPAWSCGRCSGHVGSEAPNTVVVVREPKAAPLAAEDRQQAVTALAIMIHQWWSGGGATAPMLFADRIHRTGAAAGGGR